MAEPLLSVRGLRLTAMTSRGSAAILRGVDLDLPRGRVLGIVGESGSGKSSFVNAVMGLLDSSLRVEGRILLDGVDLLSLDPAAMRSLRGRRLAMIFQDPMTALNPVFRVGTLLADVVRRRHPGASRAEARRIAAEALARVGLPDPGRRLDDYPGALSGGMRQRVTIAMALICRPDLLIADEPTTALDATIEAQIIELMIGLRREISGTIIFISHHLGTVLRLCDEVAVMYGGHVVERGPVRDVLLRPLHPYARALVACEVDDAPPDVPLRFIPGRVPEPVETPPGCIFAPRCPHAAPVCLTAMPPLRSFRGDQAAACARLEEIAA